MQQGNLSDFGWEAKKWWQHADSRTLFTLITHHFYITQEVLIGIILATNNVADVAEHNSVFRLFT